MNTKAQRLKNLRGMRDLLPAEYAIYKQVHHHLRDGVEKYGYQEMKTPILESTSLFRRLLGTDSDIVQKVIIHVDFPSSIRFVDSSSWK